MKSKKAAILAIFAITIFLRFYNYTNRWGLGYDQASFAIVGKYAADSFQIPLLGPFSSGGPFQTGGMWYWMIMAGTIFFPGLVYGPWLFMGVLSIAFVGSMIIAGALIGGTTLGIIAGLLSAVSTAQMTQSTNLSNQTPIGLASVLALTAGLSYIKTKKPMYLLFLGLGIGAASSIHLQGLGLLPLALSALVLGGMPSFKGLILLGCGLIAPWIPVLWADAGHGWYNTKNMIYYYTVDQYRISLDVLGRRWLTFATQFIPTIWGFTIGGYRWVGATTIATGFILAIHFLCIRFKRLRLAVYPELVEGQGEALRNWLLVILSFAGMLVVVRYTRVPLYDSFVVFLHPFILLLTAGIALSLFRLKKILGILFILLLVLPTMAKNVEEITHATNLAAKEAQRLKTVLVTTFPSQTFVLYDYRFGTAGKTMSLLLYLKGAHLLSPQGHRVGISFPADELAIHPVIQTDEAGIVVYDLQSSTSAELLDARWAYLDFKVIYDSVQHWWKKKN